MSVTTRTNLATNPSCATAATNYSSTPGTGGTSVGGYNSGAGADNVAGFFRVTWTAATTAIGGSANYLQTGLAANTAYIHSVYVRSNKAQSIYLMAQYQTSASANVNAVQSSAVVLTPNVWTRINIAGTSGASVDRVVLSATASGSLWAVNDTLDMDCILIETGSTLRGYFDGSYPDGNGIDYQWTGAANGSTSTATTYVPVLALAYKSDAPGDRVEVTITDLHPSTHSVTLWRTADGERNAVRNYRRVEVVGSDFFTDYEVPLKRLVNYELEVLSGVGLGGASTEASITVNATKGWIQDPLDPTSMIPLLADDNVGEPTLMDSAIKQLEYTAEMSIINILGSNTPIALMSNRMKANNVPFHMSTNAAQYARNLRELLKQAPLLLIRPLPEWSAGLPGLCYVAPPTAKELPINEAWGGTLTEWHFDTGLVAAPTMKVIVPTWTYGDWQALWSTYQQAQTALAGKTYLAVKKSPSGA